MSIYLQTSSIQAKLKSEDYPNALNELYNLLIWIKDKQDDSVRKPLLFQCAFTIVKVLTHPKVQVNQIDFEHFCILLSTIANIFQISGLSSGDFGISHLADTDDLETIKFTSKNELRKALLLYSLESEYELNLHEFSKAYPDILTPYIICIINSPNLLSYNSHRRFNLLLSHDWTHLEDQVPGDHLLMAIAQLWTSCSYSYIPKKHRIKALLNELYQNWLESKGVNLHYDEVKTSLTPLDEDSKPCIVIPLENFNSGSFIYRCYHKVIQQLKEKYHLISVSNANSLDSTSQSLFDENIIFKNGDFFNDPNQLIQTIRERQAKFVYYPSIGLSSFAPALANCRLADIQAFSLGHPATSRITPMDYLIMQEQDHVDNAPAKEIIVLTGNEISFNVLTDRDINPIKQPDPDFFHIAISCTPLKLNSRFLMVCREIVEKSNKKIHFHIFPNADKLSMQYFLERSTQMLGNCSVYPTGDRELYLKRLKKCQLRLNTFPFGGSNSLIDYFDLNIPFIVLQGKEPHSQAEVGLVQQAGLSAELVATDTNDFVEKALRLIENDQMRDDVVEQFSELSLNPFFNGKANDEGSFFKSINWIIENHQKIKTSDQKVWAQKSQRPLN